MTLSFLRSLDLPQSPSLQAEKVSRVVTSFGLEEGKEVEIFCLLPLENLEQGPSNQLNGLKKKFG